MIPECIVFDSIERRRDIYYAVAEWPFACRVAWWHFGLRPHEDGHGIENQLVANHSPTTVPLAALRLRQPLVPVRGCESGFAVTASWRLPIHPHFL